MSEQAWFILAEVLLVVAVICFLLSRLPPPRDP